MRSRPGLLRALACAFVLGTTLVGAAACGTPDPTMVKRTPLAEQWLTRARVAYKGGDIEDARNSIDSALQAAPRDREIRLMKARVALTRLEHADVVKLTEGIPTTEAHQLRGRALWYQGDLDQAADELETMLRDPAVKDPWAREVSKLARWGTGRKPFHTEGGLLASVEMPQAGSALVVPMEIEGEQVLALVATAVGELVIDSTTRREPAWVNLRFGNNFEVKDVPALTQDLTPLSRQFGAQIKALLGVNLLRHLHVTFDRRGSQFVVRRDDPPPPPDASRVNLFYVRGGGMMLRASVAKRDEGESPFLVDTSAFYPLALDDSLFKRAGMDLASLKPDPAVPPNLKLGILPTLHLGAFDLPQVPAVQGALGDVRTVVDMDLGGVIGAGLLSVFRVTFGGDGRFIWMEPDPGMAQEPRRPPTRPPPTLPASSAPPASSGPPAAGAPPASSGPPASGAPPTKLAPPMMTPPGKP